ncbi:hypothetical protein E2C01_028791 [Portunus trituberculatus]|uniref:Uncharacterized protein n=1 Tax=Portunus trituberculatus TaxID=210409 RepID=A0A5B7EQF6_PORTR|nr:hypothetical protein [Portunus trituberculatus]
MDASSIITQASRDEEQLNTFPPPDRGEAQVQGPIFCGCRGRGGDCSGGRVTLEARGPPQGAEMRWCVLERVARGVRCRRRCGGRAFSGDLMIAS